MIGLSFRINRIISDLLLLHDHLLLFLLLLLLLLGFSIKDILEFFFVVEVRVLDKKTVFNRDTHIA